MADTTNSEWKTKGLRRLVNALRYQSEGVRYGLSRDPAIRQVSVACVLLTIVAAFLPVSRIECLLLVLSLMLVVLVEYLNSALEAIVDRVSLDIHPLSRIAKNFGSVAVAISVLMAGLCWMVITGPLLYRWLLL